MQATQGPTMRLPAAPVTPAAGAVAATRRFHIDGVGQKAPAASGVAGSNGVPHGDTTAASAPQDGPAAMPAALAAWVTPARAMDQLLWLPSPGGEAGGVVGLIERTVAAMGRDGAALELLADEAPRLARALMQVWSDGRLAAPWAEIAPRAWQAVAAEFDLSAAGRARLERELAALAKALPRNGVLLRLDRWLPLALALDAHTARREAAARAFGAELKQTATKLRERLRMDDLLDPAAQAPAALASSVGQAGMVGIDVARLAKALPTRAGSKRLASDRRARIEAALATMEQALAAPAPLVHVVHPVAWELPALDADDRALVAAEASDDVVAAAAARFDAIAAATVAVTRAARVAALELADSYDAAVHDAHLAHLDWRGLPADVVARMPAVLALDDAADLCGPAMAGLFGLLRSGRIVHVIGIDAVGAEHGVAALYDPSVGTLAAAQRAAVVLQSTVAAPLHLTAGLRRAAGHWGPTLALVAVPAATAPWPWLAVAAAWLARATPCFLYDPAKGETWAERFDLDGNPEPTAIWPLIAVHARDGAGAAATLPEAVTFAHAAALLPAWIDHLRAVPTEAWHGGMQDLGGWLDALPHGLPTTVPYLWLVGPDGELIRAVVTRELAFACRDRLVLWRTLQEFAGIANAHAVRAAAAARAEAESEAAAREQALRQQLAAEHHAALVEAENTVIERLAGALLGLQGGLDGFAPRLGGSGGGGAALAGAAASVGGARAASATPPSATPASASPASATATASAASGAPAAAPAPEADDDMDAPYIDTPLCTSCNECTNINPKLFVYDGNKQARIGDAKAGTYAHLVKAAEKCPARCIHPGAPRQGDATADADLIARAAPFR